ncbi:hypothetical protein J4E81_002111 [Alternaria sp. BMP 2799]|nr:hypothetical protein J4E81_002111 [Alternaria sp. BMP 2799]
MRLLIALSAGLLTSVSATPVGTPTLTSRSATSVQETISLCTQYAYHSANGYEILNNLWGKDAATSGSQCTYYEGSTSTGGIKWSTDWVWQGGQDNVKSYAYAGKILTKGQKIAQITTTVTIAGYTFDLYTGYNGSMRVYSFVRAGNSDIKSFSADIKLFFNYLEQTQQFPASTQNLIVYQIGTEAFTGGPARWSASSFSLDVKV